MDVLMPVFLLSNPMEKGIFEKLIVAQLTSRDETSIKNFSKTPWRKMPFGRPDRR
jgi:hypothetical protein